MIAATATMTQPKTPRGLTGADQEAHLAPSELSAAIRRGKCSCGARPRPRWKGATARRALVRSPSPDYFQGAGSTRALAHAPPRDTVSGDERRRPPASTDAWQNDRNGADVTLTWRRQHPFHGIPLDLGETRHLRGLLRPERRSEDPVLRLLCPAPSVHDALQCLAGDRRHPVQKGDATSSPGRHAARAHRDRRRRGADHRLSA